MALGFDGAGEANGAGADDEDVVHANSMSRSSRPTHGCHPNRPPRAGVYTSVLRPSVCEGEPPRQQVRRFVGRLPVERHQGTGASRTAPDLRTPLVPADARYLDVVVAAIDGLFETMKVHGVFGD